MISNHSLSPDRCSIDEFACGSGECIPSYYHCNFGFDCADGSDELLCGTDCNFENGLCGWTNSVGLPMKWNAQQGPTQTLDTGKKQGHTYLLVKLNFYV